MADVSDLSSINPGPSSSDPSIFDHPTSPASEHESPLDSLPSSDTDSDDVTASEEASESDAEREWKESLAQLELLMTMVLVPYLGKYFGRKFAYWGWKQFMEWKYPVHITITNKALFKGTGMIEAAASL